MLAAPAWMRDPGVLLLPRPGMLALLLLTCHLPLDESPPAPQPPPASETLVAPLLPVEGDGGGSQTQTKEPSMPKLQNVLEEIVTANRILAHEGIVDSFGHVSARHPDNPNHFLLSRARAPERIEVDDIMEFTLEGEPVNPGGRAPYLERFIHGGLYEARPDVHSVVHNHSPSVIPFGITKHRLKPLLHM